MFRLRSFFFAALFLSTSFASYSQQVNPSLYQDLRWRLIGPFRAGRTVGVAGIPSQPNVFFVGVNNGGVWKTDDYGRTWNPIFDGQDTGSVGAIAVAPSNPNILYVGSGEGLRRPDLSVGDGMYKSTDGGKTWQHLGLRDGQQIGFILVDPRDANRLFVGVLGHPYGPNSERGVFRSTDGGQTFQKVLYKDENTGAIDLAFDPNNPQKIYADMWASRRPPWTTGNALELPTSGLYVSTDGGDTWRQLTKGLPSPEQGLGRIGFAVAPTDANRMYALVDAPRLGGLYVSDDAGESWRRINDQERIWGRGSDFAWVRVDPKDRDTIYVCNTSTYRSNDGGKTFTAFKGAPGGDDYHAIWINPLNPQILLLAADQGATISVNGGRTWSSWYNQPTAQFYHVITDNQFPYWVYGGQQESGSIGTASRSDYGEITFRDWHPVGVEEYGYVAPDPLNPHIIYGGKATRYNDVTHQTQDISPAVVHSRKYRFNRTAPILFSPVDPHVLYLGSNVLFKTTNGGQSWDIVSPDLTRPDPGVPANLGTFGEHDRDPMKGKHRGVIYSIGPSFQDVNTIWIGTDDGLIQITRDGGKTWTNITPAELTPWSKVAQLEASHYDANSAYAAINRFRLDDLHPYIYRTHDGGKTWQKITNGLPDDAPVNTVREDPVRKGLLFCGTERTVYVSFDDGDHWQTLQMNLPSTSIRDLVVHGDDIVVGTHGRSFWILDDITPLRQMNQQVASVGAFLFQPQNAIRVRRSTNTDTPLPPETPAGQNPPDGAVIDYLSPGNGPVTIEISDGTGQVVRRYSSDDKPAPVDPNELHVPMYWVRMPPVLPATAGMHRWVWDLHYSAIDALDHDYPISAIPHDTPREPLGPRALPGHYTVKLTAGGQALSQPLTVTMDPRVKTPEAGLREQFDLEKRIADALHRDMVALQEVRSMRTQLKKLARDAKGNLGDEITKLDESAAILEGSPSRFNRSAAATQSLAQINSQFGTVYDSVDSADVAPTTQAVAAEGDLEKQLAQMLEQWNQMKTVQVPAINEQLRRSRLPEINVAATATPNQ